MNVMPELNLHELALEFCRTHQHCDVASIEAAMNLGAIAAAEHGSRHAQVELRELQRQREQANRPQ